MSWICVCTIWYMYKRCASGLVDKSRDDEEFAEFVRQTFKRTASQHSCETTPARKRCRVDIHSSEKDYRPENFDAIPTFEQLMHASPIQQEAESLSIMDEKEVGNVDRHATAANLQNNTFEKCFKSKWMNLPKEISLFSCVKISFLL